MKMPLVTAAINRVEAASSFIVHRPAALVAIVSLVAALVCTAGCGGSNAAATEDNPLSEQDIDPKIYRYEVINATSADPPMTIMFDTATGAIWELLENKDGETIGFGKVEVKSAPSLETIVPSRFRFVPSGAKQTSHYIVDTANGRTWAWAGFKEGRSVYVPQAIEGLFE